LHPAQDIPVVVAKDYSVSETYVEDVSLKTYFRPEMAFSVDTLRQSAVDALRYMSQNVMPYPFDELILVIGGLNHGGGLEMPRMILIGAPTRGLFGRIHPVVVIHEVAHQWFYSIIPSNQALEPWLDESIAEYFTEKINRSVSQGRADFADVLGFTFNYGSMHRSLSMDVMDVLPIDRPASFYPTPGYFATIYNKGALVIQTLTNIMGENNERLFWREYAEFSKFNRPVREDFVRIAAKYVPGADTTVVSQLIATTAPVDYSIGAVSSNPADAASDSMLDTTTTPGQYKVVVHYLAKHPLPFPVELRVTCLDGSVSDTSLTPDVGRDSVVFFTPAPALSAEIDSRSVYAIDMNLLNNSLRLAGVEGAGPRVLSGLTFLVQSLISTLWGF
jgi:hypothetical protein